MRFRARAWEKIGRPTVERPVPNAIFIKKKLYLPSPPARTVCRVLLVAVARARSLLPGKPHVVYAAAAVFVTGYEVSAQCCPAHRFNGSANGNAYSSGQTPPHAVGRPSSECHPLYTPHPWTGTDRQNVFGPRTPVLRYNICILPAVA